MAHFYADIQGGRGRATRCGPKSSGIAGHIRGYHIGARVVCFYDEENDRDVVRVYRMSGSSYGGDESKLIAEYSDKPEKPKPAKIKEL